MTITEKLDAIEAAFRSTLTDKGTVPQWPEWNKTVAPFVAITAVLPLIPELRAELTVLLEPGTPIAIVDGMFDFAERECGHNPVSGRHAMSTIEEWVMDAKKRLASAESAAATSEAKLNSLRRAIAEYEKKQRSHDDVIDSLSESLARARQRLNHAI